MDFKDDLNVAVSFGAAVVNSPPNVIDFLANHDEATLGPVFILDAIAHICVQDVGESFAVACSVDATRNEVCLVVSGRCNVSSATLRHLYTIWNLMKKIFSSSTEAQRTRVLSKDTSIMDKVTIETCVSLTRRVYSFGYEAFRARLVFWIKELCLEELQESVYTLPRSPLFDSVFELIVSIMSCEKSAIPTEMEDGPSDECLDELIYNIDHMVRLAYDVLQTPGLIESWSAALGWTDELRLRKVIQEITYTHRAVCQLLSYAHRPDLPIYHMSLVVIPIRGYTPGITAWPTSILEWRKFRNAVHFQRNHVPLIRRAGLRHDYRLVPHGLRIHPECALIEFLHWASIVIGPSFIPPFEYIGTSVPPCAPCDMWIRAYVAWTGYAGEYITRGTSGRWERDCALPRLEKKVEQRLIPDILSHCCAEEGNFNNNNF